MCWLTKMLCHTDFTNISGIQSVVSVNMRRGFLKGLTTNKIIIIWIIIVNNTLIGMFPAFLSLNQGQLTATEKILISVMLITNLKII